MAVMKLLGGFMAPKGAYFFLFLGLSWPKGPTRGQIQPLDQQAFFVASLSPIKGPIFLGGRSFGQKAPQGAKFCPLASHAAGLEGPMWPIIPVGGILPPTKVPVTKGPLLQSTSRTLLGLSTSGVCLGSSTAKDPLDTPFWACASLCSDTAMAHLCPTARWDQLERGFPDCPCTY